MSANIGPKGETFEYFAACGPILNGTYPEWDKYALAPVPNDVAQPTACVQAGSLEFGEKWEQDFAIGLVWFTLISSLALWVYYTWATFKATCGWEEFYVVNMESALITTHLVRLGHPAFGWPGCAYGPFKVGMPPCSCWLSAWELFTPDLEYLLRDTP